MPPPSCGIPVIVLGVAFSEAISMLSGRRAPVSLLAVGRWFLFSAAIGIFFGYFRARKAARLDPIEAPR